MGQREKVRVEVRPIGSTAGNAGWTARTPPLQAVDSLILRQRREVVAALGVAQGDVLATGDCLFTSGVPAPDGSQPPPRCVALFGWTTVAVSLPEKGRERGLYRVRVLEIATDGYLVIEHHLRRSGSGGGRWRTVRTDTISSMIS